MPPLIPSKLHLPNSPDTQHHELQAKGCCVGVFELACGGGGGGWSVGFSEVKESSVSLHLWTSTVKLYPQRSPTHLNYKEIKLATWEIIP